jgi:hypothetical protein
MILTSEELQIELNILAQENYRKNYNDLCIHRKKVIQEIYLTRSKEKK